MSNVLKDKAIERVRGDKVICLHMKHFQSPISTPWIALPDKAVLFRIKCNLGACKVASCLNTHNEFGYEAAKSMLRCLSSGIDHCLHAFGFGLIDCTELL